MEPEVKTELICKHSTGLYSSRDKLSREWLEMQEKAIWKAASSRI
jgi:biotin operon repressor